jgi:hypothetical protein
MRNEKGNNGEEREEDKEIRKGIKEKREKKIRK